ncbi:MAG: penicillin-binding protein 2 [Candidatus Roizmanbacteria bacterium]
MIQVRIIFVFFIVCLLTVIGKLFFLQVIGNKDYSNDYLTTTKLLANRGVIYDSNNAPLVMNENIYLLFAEPKLIKNKEEFIHKLLTVVQVEQATLEARLDMNKGWVALTSNLTEEQKMTIEKLDIKGIGFDQKGRRYYPEGSISAHILGFVGKKDDGSDIGYFGVEGYYDKELVGLPGFLKSERDLSGRPIFFGTQQRLVSENGRDLQLTIDKSVQNIIKAKLVSGLEHFQAKEGCVIVADPYTMKILGLSCLPDFGQDDYFKYDSDWYKNPAISDTYEPGSTFKPLIVAAGIEEKKIQPDETYDETGPVQIGEYQIRTWNNKYNGMTNITQVLEHSSNVGMVYIGNKLGNQKVYDYIQKYGIGQETGIDLQGESSGLVKKQKDWYEIDYATATFGQGLAVTPLQLITAFSSVINGGYLMRPYVVQKIIEGDNGRVREREPKIVRRVISEKTSDILKKMLRETVTNGEYKYSVPKGYDFGGKTGTAQIALKGTYDTSKTIASFIGFVPVNKPRFIALVIIKEPGSSQWGSETAAPLFFDIAKDLLVYYNISPSE